MAIDFKFASNFPNLTQADYDNAYDTVLIEYSGINKLWAELEETLRDGKRLLCYNYLVAWHLANIMPSEVQGVSSDGGKPLTSKSIGGTNLSFKDIVVQAGMEQFTTNAFGLNVLRMFQGAPERMKLYG